MIRCAMTAPTPLLLQDAHFLAVAASCHRSRREDAPFLAASLPSRPSFRAMKSLPVAYVLWLLGGWWGAHHLYLGRDGQAALYCTTLGGFLLGWVRDAWRLPAYVDWANGATEQVELLRVNYRLRPKQPPISPLVLAVQLLCGAWFGMLAADALNLLQVWPVPRFPTLDSAGGWPELIAALLTRPQLLRMASVVLRVLGVSVGVWLTGNAHRCQRAPLGHVVLGSLFLQLSLTVGNRSKPDAADADDAQSAYATNDFRWLVVLAAMVAYYHSRSWSREALDLIGAPAAGPEAAADAVDPPVAGAPAPPVVFQAPRLPQRGCKTRWRLLRFLAFGLLFCALLASFAMHCSMVPHSGEPLKVTVRRMQSDPSMQELWSAAQAAWTEIQEDGYEAWAQRFAEVFVRQAVRQAGAKMGYTPEELETLTIDQLDERYETLSREPARVLPPASPKVPATSDQDVAVAGSTVADLPAMLERVSKRSGADVYDLQHHYELLRMWLTAQAEEQEELEEPMQRAQPELAAPRTKPNATEARS